MDGINVDRLEEIWAKDLKEVSTEEQSKKPYQALLYTVPIFHNPTGTILSPGAPFNIDSFLASNNTECTN